MIGFTSSDEAYSGSCWRRTPWWLRLLGYPPVRRAIWRDDAGNFHEGKWQYAPR